MYPLRRLVGYQNRYRLEFFTATAFSFLNKLFDIAPEILIGVAVDVVVRREKSFVSTLGISDPWDQVLFLGGVTLAIWVFESLFEYLYSLKWRGLAQRLQHDLRIEVYSHAQRLDVGYFESKSSGNLATILNDDINQLERFLDGGANALIQVLTSVFLIGVVFFILAPKIAMLAVVPIPIILAGAFYFQKRAEPLYAEVRARAGELGARLNNNLSGIQTIKSQVAEDFELEQVMKKSGEYRDANHRAIALSSAFIPVIRMAILCGFMATLLVGGKMTLTGQLEVAVFSLLVYLTQRLLWPLTQLAQTVDLYQRAMASTQRIFQLLDTPIQILSGTEKLDPMKMRGEIKFKEVGFSYSERAPIFKKVDFVCEAGKTTALVGPTGSGKSTAAKLMLRFYEPTEGKLLLDGKDLADFEVRSLRSQIGYVGQDVFLIDSSIKENIAYGSPEATYEEIVAAAKAAEAHEFITQLPQGYDTLIGERGQKLSGGQKQRVAIARAILKDPPILIFDEATSAVDNETEKLLQLSLERLGEGRTMVLIAHRLSTVRNADRIYVMQNGRVVEEGTHDNLVEKASGVYAGLWNVQTGHALHS